MRSRQKQTILYPCLRVLTPNLLFSFTLEKREILVLIKHRIWWGGGKAPLKQSNGLISVTLNLTQHVHQSGTDLGNFVVNTPAQMMDPVQEGHKSHWRPKIPKRYIFQ